MKAMFELINYRVNLFLREVWKRVFFSSDMRTFSDNISVDLCLVLINAMFCNVTKK